MVRGLAFAEAHVCEAVKHDLSDMVQDDGTINGVSAHDCGEGRAMEATMHNGGMTSVLRDFWHGHNNSWGSDVRDNSRGRSVWGGHLY